MVEELKRAVLRYTASHTQKSGATFSPTRGLYFIQRTSPGDLKLLALKPLMCLVLQGQKSVSGSCGESDHCAGDLTIVDRNAPESSRISKASAASPYLALAMELDSAVVANLAAGAPEVHAAEAEADTANEVSDAFRRLVSLLHREQSLAVLKDGLVREIHHWLLRGRQGSAIRNLGLRDRHAPSIERALAILRADYSRPVNIERLAAAAGMSRSAFYRHFRAVTSVSPLQYQKTLRLIEARRLILSKGKALSQVAYEVGYQSASQFSREYSRMYGQSPGRERKSTSNRFAVAIGGGSKIDTP